MAKEPSNIYKCKLKIIAFVITKDGLITKHYDIHLGRIDMDNKIKSYKQLIVFSKDS